MVPAGVAQERRKASNAIARAIAATSHFTSIFTVIVFRGFIAESPVHGAPQTKRLRWRPRTNGLAPVHRMMDLPGSKRFEKGSAARIPLA